MYIESWLQQQWRANGPAQLLLTPLSWLFAVMAAVRRGLYRRGWLRQTRLPVPVIVVGNISVGGTGKTPLVLWLAQRLREQGLSPGIVSRGFGGSAQAARAVDAATNASEVGDEPVLLAQRSGCPVWVGARRAEAGAMLLRAHPQCNVILCDDGLQHYALARDVEIAVIDAARGFGNGRLLPAGPLREPTRRLQQVDGVVLNGELRTVDALLPSGIAKFAMRLTGDTVYLLHAADDARPLISLLGQRVHAVAGIGHPQRFFHDLRAAGLDVIEHAFPDHHAYRSADLAFGDELPVVMTEKDAVKCQRFAKPNWFVRPVQAQVDAALMNVLLKRMRRRDGSPVA